MAALSFGVAEEYNGVDENDDTSMRQLRAMLIMAKEIEA